MKQGYYQSKMAKNEQYFWKIKQDSIFWKIKQDMEQDQTNSA